MNFLLQRYSHNQESTQGLLLLKEGDFVAHSIEDQPQDKKVMGETRIPAGFYELKLQKHDTPLTLKHRVTYNKGEATPWFTYHIEVCNVPGFTGVYIHSGVNDDHSEGCILLTDTIHNNQIETTDAVGARSLQAVKRFYQKVQPILDGGSKCFIEIRNEDKIQ
jgi:hypothetical protein